MADTILQKFWELAVAEMEVRRRPVTSGGYLVHSRVSNITLQRLLEMECCSPRLSQIDLLPREME